MSYSYLVVILSAIIGLIVATYFFWNVVKRKVKNQELSEIADLIQEGSAAFLKREYAILTIFVLSMFAVLWVVVDGDVLINLIHLIQIGINHGLLLHI